VRAQAWAAKGAVASRDDNDEEAAGWTKQSLQYKHQAWKHKEPDQGTDLGTAESLLGNQGLRH
jgi:hypothetical protein